MVSRRGFIKGALALVAVAKLPTQVIDKIVDHLDEDVREETLLSIQEINRIMKEVYMKPMLDQIFMSPPLFARYEKMYNGASS